MAIEALMYAAGGTGGRRDTRMRGSGGHPRSKRRLACGSYIGRAGRR